jgi:hypothetical protein
MTRGIHSLEDRPIPLAEAVANELLGAKINHAINVRIVISQSYPEGRVDRVIEGVTAFRSVREFAAALERAGADASYSAGRGWYFHAAAKG